MLNLDPERLYAKGLSPQDVLNTLLTSNVILPGGTVKFGNYEYGVMLNSSPVKVDDFNRMPIKYQNRATVYVGDVARASDSNAVQTDIARVNGAGAPRSIDLEARLRLDADGDQRGEVGHSAGSGPRARRNENFSGLRSI